jgi:NAD(P)-dependent dehydrogenase (short-subunit alcohol dehydrogenase family)
MFSLSGLNCVVTGGTSGIGYGVAERFAAAGARVAIVGRRANAALANRAGAKTHIVADCATEQGVANAIRQAARELGPLDVIVNNAGLENTGPMIEAATAEELRRVFDLNTYGVFFGLKYGIQHARDGASIVNTASIAAFIGVPGYSQYSASKAAVVSLTQTAAIEFAPRNIRVNAVCPGSVYTEMLPESHPEVDLVRRLCPLGRIGTTDELVGIYHFLASPESRYITGQAIAVDGGVVAGVSLGTMEAIANASAA